MLNQRIAPRVFVLAAGCLAALTSSQTAASAQPSGAMDLLVEAERLYWLDNWVKARSLYERAERLFSESGDERNAALARISRLRADADRTSYPEVARLLTDGLNNPVVANDPQVRLRCLMVKAAIELSIDPTSSAETWKQALHLAETSAEKRWIPRIQGELGIIAFLEGDNTQARTLMTKATMSAMMSGDIAGQIRALSVVGVGIAEIGEYERSLRYFDQALTLAEKNPEVRFPLMAHMGKAHSLDALGRSAEARQWLEKAAQFVKATEMTVYKADVYQQLGQDAFREKKYEDAVRFLVEAVESARRFEMPRPRAAALLTLSRVYVQMGEMAKADECASEAVSASRQLVDMYVLPRHLAAAAEIKVLRGKVAEADELYEEAGDLIEAMLVNVPSARMRSTLVAAMSEVYIGHFRLAAQQLNDPGKAFLILERARGRAAADALRSLPSHQQTRSTDKAAAERQVIDLQIRLQRTTSPAVRRDLLKQLAVAEETFVPVHFEQHRFNKFLRGEPVRLAPLRGVLRDDELIVEYVLAEPTSFALLVSKETLQIRPLPGMQQIAKQAERFLADAKTRGNSARISGQLLAQSIVNPINELSKKRRLILVPDGILHLVPFDALPAGNTTYLGDTKTISIAPSATVLHLIRSNSPNTPKPTRLLAVGNVQYSVRATGSQTNVGTTRGLFDASGSGIGILPSTAEEIDEIAALAGQNSVVLQGKGATERTFKQQPLSDFTVLHLAVHGVADAKFPDRSALVFASEPDSKEDGLLQIREIDALPLKADLVTLSACDTGAGRLQGQEGIANVVRAFLYAGSRSVVSTLWEVNDVFTSALMRRFYANLAQGQDVAEALRRSKLDLRRRLGHRASPYLWGPFTVVGDSMTRIRFTATH